MLTARAPGRVTLIGDHTDYNAGLSLPMAIDLATEATFTPKPGSFLVGVDSRPVPRTLGESPWATPPPSPPRPSWRPASSRWPGPPRAAPCKVTSTLPVGRRPLVERRLLGGVPARPRPRSRTRSHWRRPARGGAKQQARTSACSIRWPSPAHAPATRCTSISPRSRRTRSPIPEEAAFVIVHSEARRLLGDLALRRPGAPSASGREPHRAPARPVRARRPERAADPVLRRRARHVVTECARVREAERLLARGNLRGVGAVMTEGHRSLAGDYRVSVPAVDELVEHLLADPASSAPA